MSLLSLYFFGKCFYIFVLFVLHFLQFDQFRRQLLMFVRPGGTATTPEDVCFALEAVATFEHQLRVHCDQRKGSDEEVALHASLLREYRIIAFQGSSRHWGLAPFLMRMKAARSTRFGHGVRLGGGWYQLVFNAGVLSAVRNLFNVWKPVARPNCGADLPAYMLQIRCAMLCTDSWARMRGNYLSNNIMRKLLEHASFSILKLRLAELLAWVQTWSWDTLKEAWADEAGLFSSWVDTVPVAAVVQCVPLPPWYLPMFSCLFKKALVPGDIARVWLLSRNSVEDFKKAARCNCTVLETTRAAMQTCQERMKK